VNVFQGIPSVSKWLSYLLNFCCPKIIVWFSCLARNLRLKVNIFVPNFHHQKVFQHHNFGGQVIVVFVFILFWETYLQLLSQWSTGLNLAKVRNTDNHFETEGVYITMTYTYVSSSIQQWLDLQLLWITNVQTNIKIIMGHCKTSNAFEIMNVYKISFT
jgi:hypothetical protein